MNPPFIYFLTILAIIAHICSNLLTSKSVMALLPYWTVEKRQYIVAATRSRQSAYQGMYLYLLAIAITGCVVTFSIHDVLHTTLSRAMVGGYFALIVYLGLTYGIIKSMDWCRRNEYVKERLKTIPYVHFAAVIMLIINVTGFYLR